MSITRFELTIHLTTTSPLHSGGVDAMVDPTREGLDREVVATRFARDAHERPILTGRSVKGAVRAACARYLESNPEFDVAAALKNAQASLWGDRGKKSPSGTPLRASALTFHTVEIPQTALVGSEPDESSNIERRETGSGDQSRRPALPRRVGIAMNRYWGAVGDGALFEHEFVPGGTELTLVITAEGVDGETTEKHARSTSKADNAPGGDTTAAAAPRPATAAEVKALLKLIVGLFQAGRVFFGGRQGAGWGRVELDEKNPAEFRELTLSNRADLKALLIPTDCDSSSSGTRLTPTDCGSSAGTRITIIWNSPAGILVADPGLSQQDKAKRKKEREAALAEGRDVDDEPVPTVSLRADGTDDGPLVLPGSSVRGALRSRASRIARTVLVGALGHELDDWSKSGVGVHDQLAADPTLVRDLFGTTERRGALSVLDTLASSSGTPRTVTHNAGDRWTGGVAEGALYSEEVRDVAWNAITLELDPDRLPADDSRRRAAWCLLGLVLAELATGTLPLGSRGTRGLGQVEVKGITVTGLEWLGLPDGGTKSFTAGAGRSGRDVAKALLGHLKAVNTMITPNAGSDAAGWSSYLIDVEEKRNG